MTDTGETKNLANVSVPYKSTGRWPLAEHVLPSDFREFLKLLNDAGVEYLLMETTRSPAADLPQGFIERDRHGVGQVEGTDVVAHDRDAENLFGVGAQ